MIVLSSRRKDLSILITLTLLLCMLHAVTPDNLDLKFYSNENVTTSNNTNHIIYDLSTDSSQENYACLAKCKCIYDASSLRLEIVCAGREDISDKAVYNSSSTLDLSTGIRVLILKNLTLNSKTIKKIIPNLAKNTLIELELHHAHIDAFSFFNSKLFGDSKESLRKLYISKGFIETSEIFTMDYRDILKALATLQNLDSLVICDSNPSLSQVILQALPQLNHIEVFNSSLSDLYYLSFSHLDKLLSLNLSFNHIQIIPNGLLDSLSNLKSFDVSHNGITHLQEDVFEGLTSLRKLNLSHNKIEYVDAEVFSYVKDLQTIDLSYNEVIQFFEPYFKHNTKLRAVLMKNAWVANTFINENTAYRSYKEMEGLINTLQRAEILDLSDNEMNIIPETLSHVPKLSLVYLQGNPWECNCDDRWFLDWISTTNVSLGRNNLTDNLLCHSKYHARQLPLLSYLQNLSGHCNNSNIIARTPFKYYAIMGKEKMLSCHTGNNPWPKITWITPSKNHITINDSSTSGYQSLTIKPNGALFIEKVTGADYGLYLCIASYQDINITHYVHLGMDVSIFQDVRIMSIIAGLISSFSFLFLVLLAQLIRHLLIRSGLQCIAVRTANQSRRVRTFFDSIEQQKTSQLEWLRQNYNMQAKKIQDNCISQLERIRESYISQTKNLSEFCGYSGQQITTMREQYNDQIRKVASYSAHRLGKVRENYVFNRNRVCKFSSHQLLRLREAYKWQAHTLNKILENLPQGLNLDACRGVGGCGHTESIYLDEVSDSVGGGPSMRSSVKVCQSHGSSLEEKSEHISLLIPPELLASYLNSPFDGLDNPKENLMMRMRLVPAIDRIRQEMGDGDNYFDQMDYEETSDTSAEQTTPPAKSIEDNSSSESEKRAYSTK